MNKLIAVMLSLVTTGCSAITVDENNVNPYLSNAFSQSECMPEGFGSNIDQSSKEDYGIDFYFSLNCTTVDLVLTNLADVDYKCLIQSLHSNSLFVLSPGEEFRSTITRVEGEDSFSYECGIYNMLPTLALWNTDFIYRVVEGVREFQYYNDEKYAQTCTFFNEYDDRYIAGVHIEAMSWSSWRRSYDLDINDVKCQPVT
jgi:hypothetical protein